MISFDTAAVILAAGRGTRLNAQHAPKVMMLIAGKPIVAHTVENLRRAGFAPEQVCLVIGFQGDRVREFFGADHLYAEQKELKGTAHAAYTGMKALPETIKHVLVLGGDDGVFYEPATIAQFIAEHKARTATVSLLTAEVDNPSKFGRIVRTPEGRVHIREKEYITEEQARIQEVSTGTFCFDRQWFELAFPQLPQMKRLGEYGLPTAFVLAQEQGKSIHCMKLQDAHEWFGVNTIEELQEADRRKKLSTSL